MSLSERDIARLRGVHPNLVRVVARAASMFDFMVIEGLRTIEKQRLYVASGASHTLDSKHLTGRAVDLACLLDGQVCWKWPLYDRLNEVMQRCAALEGVHIVWGGSWTRLKDGVHFELQDVDGFA
jgi:peptidoglycan L-alanyl-D-glutamate endopeptidase CwlK